MGDCGAQPPTASVAVLVGPSLRLILTAAMEFNVSMGLDFQRGDIANKKTKVGFASGKSEKVEELFKEQTVGLQTK